MTFEKEKLGFGESSFVGSALNDPEFYKLPTSEQAKAIGWVVGCPVPNELTDSSTGRGAEAMLLRYGEIAFWGGYINRAAKEINPSLYAQLTQNIDRRADEQVGKYEPESVPESYISTIPPAETLVGYSLPRLFTKQLGGKDLALDEKQARLVRGLDVIEHSISAAASAEELLALSAEGMIQADLDPMVVLSTILSKGWYGEHNGDYMIKDFKVALEVKAPKLWEFYNGLSDQEKAINKIL